MAERFRSSKLLVWLTPGERDEVGRRAEAAGLEVSDWVRRALLGDQVEEDGRVQRRIRREAAEEA